jgi:hypothetical protein
MRLMKKKTGYLVCVLAIIATLVISGCVAPPKESLAGVTSSNNPSGNNPAEISTTITSGSAYITEVTPYVTVLDSGISGTPTPGYHTYTSPTPLPEEKSCRIYTTTQAFLYNGSAFTFNLKNPPMYINYTVTPTNITGYDVYTSRYSSKSDVVEKYDTYDPQSYLEITVRNKTSGEIYLQDGFGKEYSTYLTRTLKVLKTDDLLVEIKGNKMTATINFWVKPDGNIDNPDNMTCTYWGQSTRDNTALALVTATATPTWTH